MTLRWTVTMRSYPVMPERSSKPWGLESRYDFPALREQWNRKSR